MFLMLFKFVNKKAKDEIVVSIDTDTKTGAQPVHLMLIVLRRDYAYK
jgi:hypothetical protein|tara:strand:+ start:1014 stop:1154 length:141 start_codon:yes stop_codon:yes gene_type:complete